MNWIRKIFGNGSNSTNGGTNAPPPSDEAPMITLDDPRYMRFAEARDAYWRGVGTLDDDVIAYLISPQFQGKPAWPTTRQAYRTVRTTDSVIIASDGMTDLFVDTNMPDPGFRTEVYIETPSLIGADFDTIKRSWAFDLIENFAANIADAGGIDHQLERHGILSIELPAPESLPQEWRTSEDFVGALINVPTPGRQSQVDLGDGVAALMVPLTLLTPAETAYVVEHGAQGRAEIARRLSDAGIGARSDLSRASRV